MSLSKGLSYTERATESAKIQPHTTMHQKPMYMFIFIGWFILLIHSAGAGFGMRIFTSVSKRYIII